ncbi:hypothetical protein [Myceligenerans salitolerans]|uniref:Peptidase MA-like domain-containing protein n=1 Tax=Myceligenerans salitolerans TaxID=1230528 RepID=A0ABS3IDK4_9MICO|nr:hypothetical protein [Myceligenerans salitolerans]MBO0611125.1 hypothetical protein [Myceligenerans salitolerans]
MARTLAAAVVYGTAVVAPAAVPAAVPAAAAQDAPVAVAVDHSDPSDRRESMASAAPRGTATAPLGAPVAGARLPALIADGLAESSHSRYVYDGGSETVKVTVRTTIRNLKPDQGLMYFFWNSYGVPVPKGAQNVTATSAGQSLSVRFEPTEDEFTNWATASFSNLRYGQSRTIDWSYTIPGDPIRSEGYTRVGKGYATFATQAVGDPGSVSVEVVAPEAMEFTNMVGEFSEEKADGRRTWSTSAVTDEYGIWSPVSLRNPDQADTTQVKVGGEKLTLLSFPDDKKWTTFVKKRLTDGLPVVEDMVGQDWPGGLKQIREDVSPEVIGYAWYDGQTEEIVIGEDLDEQLFYHELTHTWVNGETLEGRWLVEGLTETIARRVVKETGGKVDRRKTTRDADGALALSTWEHPAQDFRDVDRPTEDYAYAAAPATVEKLVADLDDKQFTDLVAALLEGQSAYEEPGDKHVWKSPGWRQLLDLLEDRAGVEGAQKTLKTWVLTEKEKKELPKRAEEREHYFALDEADGEWEPPQGVRVRMTQWEFDRAAEAREAIGDDVPEAARRIQEAAAAAGFPDPSAARDAYEKAGSGLDYTELTETMPRTADVTEQVSEAVRRADAERDPVTELAETMLFTADAADLAVQDLDEGDVDAAAEGAAHVSQLVDLARWVGILLVVLVLGVVLLVAWLVIRARRRRRTAPAPATPDLPAEAGVSDQVEQWLSDRAEQPGDGSSQPSTSSEEAPAPASRPGGPGATEAVPPLPPHKLPPPTGPWDTEPDEPRQAATDPDDSAADGRAAAGGSPGDDGPADDATAGGAPAGDASAAGAPAGDASAEDAPADGGTPDDEAPAGDGPDGDRAEGTTSDDGGQGPVPPPS